MDMRHLIRYGMIVKVKNFNMFFWPLIFPLLMATMFYFAFGRLDEADFETIPVAVVENTERQSENSKFFLELLKEMEEADEKLIRMEQMTGREAMSALEQKAVDGIFYVQEQDIRLAVGENGIAESILQSVLESYENGKQIFQTVSEQHPEGMEAAIRQMSAYQSRIEQVSLGGHTTNGNVQFFYALIAMACLYGAFIGLGTALCLQANLTSLAARRCVTPTKKRILIFSEMCSAFILHFFNVMLLVLYIRYILKQELNGSLPEIMLTVLAGCVIGVSLGIFIGSINQLGESVKIAVMLGISMSCSFFAGLMNGTMKYAVEQHVPILNRINPAAVITDALYCINVYDDGGRYIRNLLILGSMAAVLLGVSVLKTRRKRYDSI